MICPSGCSNGFQVVSGGDDPIARSSPLTELLTGLVVPLAALALLLVSPAWLLSGLHPVSRRALLVLLRYLPVVLWAVGTLLALYFNSSRLGQVGVLMLLVYLYVMIPYLEPLGGWEARLGPIYHNSWLLFGTLIPLNFVLIHCTEEDPTFSLAGLGKLLVMPLELMGVVALFALDPRMVFRYLDRVPQLRVLDGRLNLPLVPLSLCVLALIVYWMLPREPSYSRSRGLLLGAMLAGVLAFESGVRWFEAGRVPMHHALMFTAGGLLFAVKVVDLAWGKAYLDPLTGVPGRKAMEEYLAGLRGTYTLAMVDVDRFKKFNDKYGHRDGDRVLKLVARVLSSHSSGRVFRFGGEEFLIVFNGRGLEEVTDELDAVRRAVADRRVTVTRKSKRATKELSRRVTVSVGAAASGERFGTPQEVLNAADKALYRAKDDGRNRVETP